MAKRYKRIKNASSMVEYEQIPRRVVMQSTSGQPGRKGWTGAKDYSPFVVLLPRWKRENWRIYMENGQGGRAHIGRIAPLHSFFVGKVGGPAGHINKHKGSRFENAPRLLDSKCLTSSQRDLQKKKKKNTAKTAAHSFGRFQWLLSMTKRRGLKPLFPQAATSP